MKSLKLKLAAAGLLAPVLVLTGCSSSAVNDLQIALTALQGLGPILQVAGVVSPPVSAAIAAVEALAPVVAPTIDAVATELSGSHAGLTKAQNVISDIGPAEQQVQAALVQLNADKQSAGISAADVAKINEIISKVEAIQGGLQAELKLIQQASSTPTARAALQAKQVKLSASDVQQLQTIASAAANFHLGVKK